MLHGQVFAFTARLTPLGRLIFWEKSKAWLGLSKAPTSPLSLGVILTLSVRERIRIILILTGLE